jgi:methylmalonyl-CoA mutase, N-terminal domain
MWGEGKLERIAELQREWEADVLEATRRRMPERQDEFTTLSGHEVKALYTPADVPDLDYEEDLGFPGQYPFTRGVHPNMYRGRLWTIRQFMGFAHPSESNQRLKYLMEHGAPGLNVAFDLPTIHGMDSDNPLALGEVGREGVPIDTLEDMEALFDGIPLGKVSVSLVIAYPPIPAMYLAVAEKQGVKPQELRGTFQNDMLCRDGAANVRVVSRRGEMKLCVDVVEYATRNMPLWYPISVVGYQIREKGCSAVQELAFTLADGICYVDNFVARGLGVDEFGPRISFMFNAHNDFFEEIAKYRAARRMWARIMKERFGAEDPRSMMIRFHTQTAGCSLTPQQPELNIVRTTIQALAAILGGTQSLHTNSMDEALALPTEDAVRIAVRTQQVIAHESGVTSTADPMGGSYYVEYLTNRMEEEAWEIIERIDELGGALEALEKGFIQKEVAREAYRYQRDIEEKKRIVVGSNEYVQPDEELRVEIMTIDEEFEGKMRRQVRAFRERRDEAKTAAALERLKEAAFEDRNTMEPAMEAVKAGATLQDVWDVYRERYGRAKESGEFISASC